MRILIVTLLLIPSLSWGEYLACKKYSWKYEKKSDGTLGDRYKEYEEEKTKYLYLYEGRIKTAITTPDKMDDEDIQEFYEKNKVKYAIIFENEYFNEISGDSYDEEYTGYVLEGLDTFSGFMEEVVNLSTLFHEGKKNDFDNYIFFIPDISWKKRADVELKWIIINRFNLEAYIRDIPPKAIKKGLDFEDVQQYEIDNPKPKFPMDGDFDAKDKWRAEQNIWNETFYEAVYERPSTYQEFINLNNDFFERMLNSWFDYDCSIIEKPEKLI